MSGAQKFLPAQSGENSDILTSNVFVLLSLLMFIIRWLEVQLPRFQMDCTYMLRDALQNLKITNVFEAGAEINNLGVSGVRLDQVTLHCWSNISALPAAEP